MSQKKKKKPLYLINPEITFTSKNTSVYEGLFISAWPFAEIERPASVI